MSESLHDIDQFFQKRLEEHSEKPSPAVWESIEAGLDKRSAATYKNKYIRLKRAAVLIFLLLSGILAYEIIIHHGGSRISNNNEAKKKEAENITIHEKQSGVQDHPTLKSNDIIPSSGDQKDIPSGKTVNPEKNLKAVNEPGFDEKNKKVIPENGETMNRKNISRPQKDGDTRNKGLKEDKKLAKNKSIPVPAETVKNRKDKTSLVNIKKPANNLNKEQQQLVVDRNKTRPGKQNDIPKDIIAENKTIPVLPDHLTKDGAGNMKTVKTNHQPVKDRSLAIKGKEQDHKNGDGNEETNPVNLVSADLPPAALIHSGHILIPSQLIPGNNNVMLVLTLPGNKTISLPATINIPAAPSKSGKADLKLKGHPLQGFSFSVSFAPNAKINLLKNDDEGHRGPQGHDGRDQIKESEHNDFSFTTGVKINIPLNGKVALQTGLNYSSSISSISPKYIFAERDNNGDIRYRFNCTSGYSYFSGNSGSIPSVGDSVLISDSKNKVSYLSVPILLSYGISMGKFTIYLEPGLQSSFLLNGKTSSVLNKGTVNEQNVSSNTQSLRPVYLSLVAGISGEFKLSRNIALQIKPQGQFGITSINKGSVVKTHSSYVGMGVGIKIKL